MKNRGVESASLRGLFVSSLVICLLLAQSAVSAAPDANKIEFWNDSEEQSGLKIDYTTWTTLLSKFVVTDHPSGQNRFDYDSVSESDQQALGSFIDYMQQMDPRQITKQRQKAYWLNLYNSMVVNRIVRSKPDDSVRELGRRFWRKKRLTIAMQKISLDDIQHRILRPIFSDPRIHFSLVTGAVGSANIRPIAFTGENIDQLRPQHN